MTELLYKETSSQIQVTSTEQEYTLAPSLKTHLLLLSIILPFLLTTVYLLAINEIELAILFGLAGVIPTIFARPFIGICLLFFVAPIDMIMELGIGIGVGKPLGAFVGLSFLCHSITGRYQFRLPLPSMVGIALFLWACIALIWTPYPLISVIATSQLLTLSFIVIVIYSVCTTERHVRQLATYIFFATLLCGVLALFLPRQGYSQRATLGDVNENYFASACVFGILSALFLLHGVRNIWWRIFLYLSIILLVFSILGSQSRGMILAGSVSLFIAAILSFYRKPGRLVLVLVASTLVLFIGFWVASNYGMWSEKGLSRMTMSLGEAGASRLEIWKVGLQKAEERPMTGQGFGIFKVLVGGKDSHNVFVRIFTELGIVGLFLWCSMLLLVIRESLRIPPGGFARFATISLALMLTVSGMTLNTTTSKIMWYELSMVLTIAHVFGKSKSSHQSVSQHMMTE